VVIFAIILISLVGTHATSLLRHNSCIDPLLDPRQNPDTMGKDELAVPQARFLRLYTYDKSYHIAQTFQYHRTRHRFQEQTG